MEHIKWNDYDEYFVGFYKFEYKNKKFNKVGGFDLDSTLIKPINNKKFSDNSDDWMPFNNSVKDKLHKLFNDGYDIVIFTNQNGIYKGIIDKKLWKKKIENVANFFNVPFIILTSIKKDNNRKPITNLWDTYITNNINSGENYYKQSFYCGDAGGLPARKINNLLIKKDFSDSDLKFAINLGLKFIHRDEFILDHDTKCHISYGIDFDNIKKGKYNDFVKPNFQELIIMVGFPGSGKTFYSTNYIVPNNYEYVNRDTLNTIRKCLKKTESELGNGKYVVVDNTNPSGIDRKKYIDIAKKYNVKVRCIHFQTSKLHSMHNNFYRNYEKNIKFVPTIAYNIYNKKFVDPEIEEGFYSIEKMEFILDVDKISKSYYKYYY